MTEELTWTSAAHGAKKQVLSEIDDQHLCNILWFNEIFNGWTRYNSEIHLLMNLEWHKRCNEKAGKELLDGEVKRLPWKPLPVLDELQTLGVNLQIQELLGLKKLGYKIIPSNEILRIGNHCHFIHGFYTNTHHAKKHLDVFGVNVYYGHLHDVQQHSTVSVNGVHEAMSLGCLRNTNAPFLRGKPNNWSHAFGIFEFRADGYYTRYVPTIINGMFTFDGKIFGTTRRE